MVAWNGIKMRCNDTFYYVYLRKLALNWGKFSGTEKYLTLKLFRTTVVMGITTFL